MEENELIEKLKLGNREAQKELVRRYASFLFNVAMQITRRRDLAEDVAEETLITAIEKIGSFKGKSKLSTWLYRIASNKAKLVLIEETKRESTKAKMKEAMENPYEEVPAEYGGNIKKRIIWEGMAYLTDVDREIITLIDIEGMKYEEAAELLGVPVGTVRSRISRAREHLKKIILERNFFGEDVSNR